MAGEPAIHFTSGPPAVPLPADDPLTRLVRRLEAATSRLEDIAASSGSIEEQANGSISAASGAGMPKSNSMPDLPKGGSREASTSTVIRSAGEKDEAGGAQSPPAEDLPERIEEMDQLIENQVREYVDSGKGIDPLVEEQVRQIHVRGEEHLWIDNFKSRPRAWRKLLDTSGNFSWLLRKLRSQIHHRKPSWICCPTCNKIWATL